jgi:hypothetical protein
MDSITGSGLAKRAVLIDVKQPVNPDDNTVVFTVQLEIDKLLRKGAAFSIPALDEDGELLPWVKIENEYYRLAYERCDRNQKRVAKLTHRARTTVHRILKRARVI